MQLRLHGTTAEIAASVTVLATVLDIRTMNRAYPDRPPSTLMRVYLDAIPRDSGGAK
jgi:hypothetical protein